MDNLHDLEPCELRAKLRAALAREAILQEALAPFAAAWPLRAESFLHTAPGTIARQRREDRALAGFYTARAMGSEQEMHITLTGEHLREAFEALQATGFEISTGGPAHA